jgi:hypothetical protein
VTAAERCNTSPQRMDDWEGKLWSHREQLFCESEKEGFVELKFKVAKPGPYRVRILATAAPDYGRIRAAIDGQQPSPEFDLYSGRVSPAGSLELGMHELAAGEHRLRVTAIGKNGAAKSFSFGLDTLDLFAEK